jgi:hypothetical protein
MEVSTWDGQALTGEVIDERQAAEAATGGQFGRG